jgi:hypothetical protein
LLAEKSQLAGESRGDPVRPFSLQGLTLSQISTAKSIRQINRCFLIRSTYSQVDQRGFLNGLDTNRVAGT